MVGMLAVSRAGHDRNVLYLIVREEGERVYLADGVYKKYAAPKKKNRRHIQPVHSGISQKELQELSKNPADADTKIKRWIKLYQKQNV